MKMDVAKSWYVLTSKPKQDEKAEYNLLNQGYEVYRPLAKRLRKYRGKMIEREESLFPRYLFISLDTVNDNWAPIRSTRGVSQIVRFGMEPAKISTELINDLKASEGILSEKATEMDRFKKGETVIIETGAFKGIKAIFDCYHDGQQCVNVLFELMGKMTKLPINVTDISKY